MIKLGYDQIVKSDNIKVEYDNDHLLRYHFGQLAPIIRVIMIN